jgi:predicted HTH transcriptional regulator
VITYEGNDRGKRKQEREENRGYASGFEAIVDYVAQQAGTNEIITQSVRVNTKKYPDLALREFIANALIHQDFSIS